MLHYDHTYHEQRREEFAQKVNEGRLAAELEREQSGENKRGVWQFIGSVIAAMTLK